MIRKSMPLNLIRRVCSGFPKGLCANNKLKRMALEQLQDDGSDAAP